MGQKYRDRLLSAAMRLSDDPTKTLAFLEVVDAVLDAVREEPFSTTPKEQQRDRLLLALMALADEFDDTAFATPIYRAIAALQRGTFHEAHTPSGVTR